MQAREESKEEAKNKHDALVGDTSGICVKAAFIKADMLTLQQTKP